MMWTFHKRNRSCVGTAAVVAAAALAIQAPASADIIDDLNTLADPNVFDDTVGSRTLTITWDDVSETLEFTRNGTDTVALDFEITGTNGAGTRLEFEGAIQNNSPVVEGYIEVDGDSILTVFEFFTTDVVLEYDTVSEDGNVDGDTCRCNVAPYEYCESEQDCWDVKECEEGIDRVCEWYAVDPTMYDLVTAELWLYLTLAGTS